MELGVVSSMLAHLAVRMARPHNKRDEWMKSVVGSGADIDTLVSAGGLLVADAWKSECRWMLDLSPAHLARLDDLYPMYEDALPEDVLIAFHAQHPHLAQYSEDRITEAVVAFVGEKGTAQQPKASSEHAAADRERSLQDLEVDIRYLDYPSNATEAASTLTSLAQYVVKKTDLTGRMPDDAQQVAEELEAWAEGILRMPLVLQDAEQDKSAAELLRRQLADFLHALRHLTVASIAVARWAS